MAETIVENQICNSCGVDIRKGALFCYHCGTSVAPETIAQETDKIDGEKQVLAKESNTENGKKTSSTKLKNKPKTESALFKEVTEKPIPKPEVRPEKNLKSAASLRKTSKSIQRKKLEIIWEEYDNAPNVWFILATVLSTIFVAGALWLALYFG